LLNLRDHDALKFRDGSRLLLLHLVSRRKLMDLLYRQLADTLAIGIQRMEEAANGFLVFSR